LQTGRLLNFITTLILNKLTFKVPMERKKETKIFTKQNILETNNLFVRIKVLGKKKCFLLKNSNYV
jgi:hypothetical protein